MPKKTEYWVAVGILVEALDENDAEEIATNLMDELRPVVKDVSIQCVEYNHEQDEE